MNRGMLRQFANIMGFSIVLIINSLSQTLPFNNQTSADIANRYQNYFLPANYVFGIWGLIYVGLIAFAVFQALPSQRENPRLKRMSPWFLVSCAANCIWLFLFHYNQFALSTVAMGVLIASLIIVHRQLRAGNSAIGNGERWCVRVPFSIYLGWITVATVANVAYVFKAAGWDGAGISEQTWGILILVVAGSIAGIFAYLNRDIAYAAVIVWSFVGIISRWDNVMPIVVAAAIMSAVVGIAALIAFFTAYGGDGNRPLQARGA